MTPRRFAALALLLLGGMRVEAQGRVVPEPGAPARKGRVVPAPRPRPPRATRPPRAQSTAPVRRDRTKSRVAKPVPAPASRAVEPQRAAAVATAPGGDISATLITFGIGEAVWERFGHNALWIHDARAGTDIAYNWGLFDFEQPGFFRRFLTGDTKYWMGGEDAYAMVSAYQGGGRPVTLQMLNLTPAQAQSLNEIVRRNALEENKYYRYDYFRDNCSTRLRDALDRAVGGALRAATDTMRTALTYRSESVRLTDGDVPVQTGIDIALGRPADTPLSAWESFFIPMRLRDGVRIVNVARETGELVPLVSSERILPPVQGAPRVVEARMPPDHTRRNLTAGILLAVIAMLLRLLMRSRRWAAWVLALLGMLWSLVCGTLGVVLLLAWLVTKHHFWAANENLLVLSPVSLLLVVFVPAALLGGRAIRRARIVGGLVAGMGLAALAMSLLAGGQVNRPIVALLLPMHLALAAALLMFLPRTTRPAPATRE
ncbi:MAG TPA: DUF4105 domain-containing protein [Gemmatimonadaceae bacterium]|nr:DUF4105 domain-containing protein [Gemmatimonadaceae bacterium]